MRCTTVILLAVTLAGCARPRPRARAAVELDPSRRADLEAIVCPPSGWRATPLKLTDRATHQTWVSPTGDTAYGVIRFSLPVPVGEAFALWGFLREMKKEEGEAILLARSKVREEPGLRFEAEGGAFRIAGTIVTRGFGGWVIYAGTLRVRPVRLDELELAVQAREKTILGLD